MEIIYKDEAFKIMGACFEAYNEIGSGFLESVYQECLALELQKKDIPFQEQAPLAIYYKGHTLRSVFKPDFVCFGKIIVEIKAVTGLLPEHRAQTLNYLKASNFKLGLLVNFGSKGKVESERIVL